MSVALVLLAGIGACSGDEEKNDAPRYNPDPKSLNIVAGSEQASVLETIVRPWCADHGYSCTFSLKARSIRPSCCPAETRNMTPHVREVYLAPAGGASTSVRHVCCGSNPSA